MQAHLLDELSERLRCGRLGDGDGLSGRCRSGVAGEPPLTLPPPPPSSDAVS